MRYSSLALSLIFAFCSLALANVSYSQKILENRVSLKLKDAPMDVAFEQISKSAKVKFAYTEAVINKQLKLNYSFNDEKLSSVLQRIVANHHLVFSIVDDVIIFKKTASKTSNQLTDIEIRGTVRDTTGISLPGVSVLVKNNSKIGTTTDVNGRFILDVPEGSVLSFSYTGFVTTDVKISGKEVLNIVLSASDSRLDEVVVVGFGTQKKISLVGAQSIVDVDELKQPVRSLNNSLAGRVPGIISVQRSGEPGKDDASIWIRGISTFENSLSAPLVLVDGVPRSFSNVDPEDVASFSVLKDASATAVYGVRGANGVILISTKKGSVGKPKISFRYNEGVTSFTKLPKFADGITYMKMSNEALVTRGGVPLYSDAKIEATLNGTDPDLNPNVDWMKKLFNDMGGMRKANLNISGGSDMSQYYVGASYYNETGLYNTDALSHYDSQVSDKRYNLTANLNIKATKTTQIDLGIQGYLENGNYPGTATNTIFEQAYYVTPVLHQPQYSDGKFGDNLSNTIGNPYVLLTQTGYSSRFKNQLFSNLRVTQGMDFLTKGLSATSMFSFDARSLSDMARTKRPNTYLATGRDKNGNLIYQTKYVSSSDFLTYSPTTSTERTIYIEAAINYNRTFGVHALSGMLNYNQSDLMTGSVGNTTTSFINSLPYRYRGLAGRITYGFKDRYFLEGNFGYNGSENFLPSHRYGFFPSAGLGWLISEEPFFEPLKNLIQFAKLRATHGIVGNSNITGRRFAYSALVTTTNNVYTFGKTFDRSLSGQDIGEYAVDVTWETATKSNIGLDLYTLGNALKLQIDLFKDNRKDIFLSRQSLPAYMGLLKNPLGNVGIIENRGVEGSMNYFKKLNNWNLQLLANLTYSKNKVIENDQPVAAYPWLEARGQKVGQSFGYIAQGLFESTAEIAASPVQTGNVLPGDIKFKDLNGDNKIDAYDKTAIGYGDVPEIVYGFGFSLGYKGLSLSTLFQGVGNMDIWLNGEGVVPFQQGLSRGNLFNNIEDRWTVENPNPNAFYPRLGNGTINENYTQSTWWMQSGRYLRLKNIQLDYGLPKKLVSILGFKNANLFLQAVNVLTFSPFKLWDVELGNGRGANYPNISTYSIGLNVDFK